MDKPTPKEFSEGLPTLWRQVKEFYTARLDALRKENDGDSTPEKTAKLRGRIAEVKMLLALDQSQAPAIGVDEDTTHY